MGRNGGKAEKGLVDWVIVAVSAVVPLHFDRHSLILLSISRLVATLRFHRLGVIL